MQGHRWVFGGVGRGIAGQPEGSMCECCQSFFGYGYILRVSIGGRL